MIYLMQDGLKSIGAIWKSNYEEYEGIFSMKEKLEEDERKTYNTLEKKLTSLQSNIDKMQNYYKENTEDLQALKKALVNDYTELDAEKMIKYLDETKFYLESYEQMTSNLLKQVHTELEIQERNHVRFLSAVSIFALLAALLSAIFGYFGMNDKPYPDVWLYSVGLGFIATVVCTLIFHKFVRKIR